jgi:hypothetical protein
MRLVASMLCLIAGASSLLLGMRAAAPPPLTSSQWPPRCSVHGMSEAADEAAAAEAAAEAAAKAAEAAAAKATKAAKAAKAAEAAPRGCSPFKGFLVKQLNEKSSDTGHSVIGDAKAIVATAGEDFKAGLATAGEDFKAGQLGLGKFIEAGLKFIGVAISVAIVSAAALLTSSLSMEFKWTFSALGLASAVCGQIRRALPAR